MYRGKNADGKEEEKGWMCVDKDASSSSLPDWCNMVNKGGAAHAHVMKDATGKMYCICKDSKVLKRMDENKPMSDA